MRRPRVRMTVRGLMVAVATVAIVLGVSLMKKRRDARLQRTEFYSFLVRKFMARKQSVAPGELSHGDQERLKILRAMRQKWEWAASHPWESVEPDSL
jgi:ABC-type ATPase involved in cell division